MRGSRNPRRAYDEAGREIRPPSVGSCRAQGETTAAVTCHGCGRHAVIATDRFPDDLPFPDISLRLQCSTCGSRDVLVMCDMQAHYARVHAATGQCQPLPESYRVIGRDVPWPEGEGQNEKAPQAAAGGADEAR